MKSKMYKQDEIKQHYIDWLEEQSEERLEENHEDLHHHCFNTDYYIIGTYEANQWLGNHVFEVIGIIKEYEQDNFGEVTTDLTDPEKIVNMYAYIVGEQVISGLSVANDLLGKAH